MSVAEDAPNEKHTGPKRRRFPVAPTSEPVLTEAPPKVQLDQALLGQLISTAQLQQLAGQSGAADQRRRKLPVEVFFWLTVLACGPGGAATLQAVSTYLSAASWVAGLNGPHIPVSKEALSENFRERPWTFFAAVLQYLLTAYHHLWQQLADRPNLQVIDHLRVMLVDTTSMKVALKLFSVFPARATGKRAKWAGVKVHVGLRLFRSVPDVQVVSAEKQNELKNLPFLRPVGEAVVYIFDLGYWAYHLFDTIVERGQHFLCRWRQDCNPPILAVYQGDPAWVGQRLKAITLSGSVVDLVVRLRGNHPTHPQMHHDVRLVGVWIEPKQAWHLYVTSLRDRTAYSVALLVDLYRLRWQIEIFFRNLKCVLRIAHFLSVTENGIRIQIYAALIHYVLTHLLILKAMQVTGRAFEDFSLPYCLQAVQQVLHQSGQLVCTGRVPDWACLEVLLLHALLAFGRRPNRKRPRLITDVKTRLQALPP
jgi:DDE family transposase